MGIYKKEIDAWIKGGSRVGHSDICGTFKSRYQFGIPFYIEGKFTETDSLSKEQIEFREEVIVVGALYLAPESMEEFYEWYQDIKFKHL